MVWLKNFFKALIQAVFSLYSWVFPFLLLGVGYAMPALRQTVSMSPEEPVYKALFWILVACVVWVAIDYMTATNRETSVRALQADNFISVMGALVMTAIGFYMVRGQDLQWYIVLPWASSVVDALLSGYGGINNAAQKPIVQQTNKGA